MGRPRGNLRDHFWQTGGLSKSFVLLMNGYIWALGRGLGGPRGGKLRAKTGGEELDGDRGVRNKPERKREGAEDEKEGPQ